MQPTYEVFNDVSAYWEARKVKAESQLQGALHKGKIEQIEAKLDMFYLMQERPEMKTHSKSLTLQIESLERELADLHRAARR
jgi:hypothetical protein